MSENLIQMPWKQLGTFNKTTTDAASVLAVTARKYSSVKAITNAVCWLAPRNLNRLIFRFRGKTDGDNAAYIDLYLGRLCGAADADLHKVITMDVEIGTQVSWNGATGYTLLADEITITANTSQWHTAAASVQNGNNTELETQLLIDPCGCDLVVFHAYGDIAAAMAVDGSGYYVP